MTEETILFILEVVGTAAFAVSGALIGIRRQLDLFGVVLVGCITAVGGGVLRDLFLNRFPPAIFTDLPLFAVAAGCALTVFLIALCAAGRFERFGRRLESVNNFFDAVGLAAFSVVGTEIACSTEQEANAVFCVTMGVVTGIGGGILRDILVDQTPNVLQKQIYALASIFGAAAYYVIRGSWSRVAAPAIAIPAVILIRILATVFHWRLPRVKLQETKKSIGRTV